MRSSDIKTKKKYLITKIINSGIEMYIRNIRQSKSVQSDVQSVGFVKLSAKVFVLIYVHCLKNV